ncbi:DUF3352 domain-containing protein [Sodalinema gerasimenkoae]|uniref:DUF3352 domain-containing protein n=1 Tax=Sodalinema gerasimenkoae TaxID=2862348 RepID=UPI00135B8401|nr:DUF3352 domain-containing protein [Sodalinema gerasimenkoae]
MRTYRRNRRKSPPWRTLAVVGLVIVGGGVLYGLLSRRPVNLSLIVGAELVPEEALMAASISTNSGQWRRLQDYGTPESQALFQEQLEAIETNLLANSDVTYEEDIAPWVGDRITLAILPPPEIDADTPPEALRADRANLLILPIGNAGRLQSRVGELEGGLGLQERNYRGVTLYEPDIDDPLSDEAANRPHTLAVVERRFLLVSQEPSAVIRAIDAYRDNQSVLNVPGYNPAWEALPGTDFASVFVNLPRSLAALAEDSTRPLNPEAIEALEHQGLASTISLESDGIRLHSLSWLNPDSETTFDLDNVLPPTLVNRFPDSAAMVMAGWDFHQLWEERLQNAQNNPLLPFNAAWFRSALQQTVGVNLETELLNWMRGEFALGLIPNSGNEDSTFPGSLVVMAETTNIEATETLFRRIDRAVVDRYGFEVNVEVEELGQRRLVTWDTRRQGLEVSHGWLSDSIVFLSIGSPVTETLLPQPDQSLLRSSRFGNVVPRDPDPSNGLFFLGLDQAQLGEEEALPLPLLRLPPEQQGVLEAIEAIGVRTGVQGERSSRYDIFVKIASP